MLFLVALAFLQVAPAQTVSPQSQAISGRTVRNNDVLNYISAANAALKSQYAEQVNQWIVNKQQQKVGTPLGPIPAPAASWIAVPHAYTPAEKLYDAAFPGIAPMIDDSETGPPVAPQYVEPTAPAKPAPGTVIDVGPFARTETQNGKLVNLYLAMPDDNMPAGFIFPGPGGAMLQKYVNSTPFGTAQWYQSLPQ
ncbi:MAG TPA: hypothetical protein VFO27_04815 [Bryobacteraceae bacterium]|nr:hypothetical protein [Bryobacteraceae bacterium]